MNWLAVAKYLAPVALLAALYFYAHDAGWRERDAKVKDEIELAVKATQKREIEACAADLKHMEGIHNGLLRNIEESGVRYADAVGRLYDASHGHARVTPLAEATGGDHAAATDHRLYYADVGAAKAALDRARVASEQAGQLIACQQWVVSVVQE